MCINNIKKQRTRTSLKEKYFLLCGLKRIRTIQIVTSFSLCDVWPPPHITERLFVSMRCTRVKASFSGTFLLIQTNTVLSHTLNHMTTVQALDLLAIKHYKRKHTTTVCWLTSHAASLLFFWESCFCTCFASHRCCNPTGKRCVTKQLLSEKLYLN